MSLTKQIAKEERQIIHLLNIIRTLEYYGENNHKEHYAAQLDKHKEKLCFLRSLQDTRRQLHEV